MPTPIARRYRTAKKIQVASVTLAVKNGLHAITTEEISQAANVSPRTFFNYYPYKEAALLGPLPDYPEGAVEDFVAGKRDVLSGLQTLITKHLSRYKGERELIKNILNVSENEPKIQALLNSNVLIRREQLSEILHRRLPDASNTMLYILSSAIMAAINNATRQWALGMSDDLMQTARDNLAQILSAAELLRQGSLTPSSDNNAMLDGAASSAR